MRCLVRVLLMLTFSAASVLQAAEVNDLQMELRSLDSLLGEFYEVKPTAWENWDLEKEEWERYQFIIENTAFAVWDHEATPYQILAIYAPTIEEKRRYARMEAKLDQWREHNAVSFQQIYNDERELVFAKYRAIVKNKQPILANITPASKLAIFVNSGKCLTRCTAVMNRVLGTGADLDIYMLNEAREDVVYGWAESARIPIDRVQTQQITLNFDKGLYNQVSSTPDFLTEFPVVYVLKNGTYEKLAL